MDSTIFKQTNGTNGMAVDQATTVKSFKEFELFNNNINNIITVIINVHNSY